MSLNLCHSHPWWSSPQRYDWLTSPAGARVGSAGANPQQLRTWAAKEAALLARLRHRNLVQLIGVVGGDPASTDPPTHLVGVRSDAMGGG